MLTNAQIKQVGQGEWQMTYDDDEANGVVTIRDGVYGPIIEVNGKPCCMIDLFYLRPNAVDSERCVQIVIDPPDGGDSSAYIRHYPDRTVMFFESNVKSMPHPDGSDNPAWGRMLNFEEG